MAGINPAVDLSKKIESSMEKGLPVNTQDPSLTNLSDSNNPWITCFLKIWNEIFKRHHLKGRVDILKWSAYEPDFMPSKYDRMDWKLSYCVL